MEELQLSYYSSYFYIEVLGAVTGRNHIVFLQVFGSFFHGYFY